MKNNIRNWALEGVNLGINRVDLFNLSFRVTGEKVEDVYRREGNVQKTAAALGRTNNEVAGELRAKKVLNGKPGRPLKSSGSYTPVSKPVTTGARTMAATISLAGSAVKLLKEIGKPVTGRDLRDILRTNGLNSNRTYFGAMMRRLYTSGQVRRIAPNKGRAYLYTT